MSRIVVVTSGKGGVGKSSVALNVSYSLVAKGMKVCLIDADFGLKNLDVMMGLENRVVYDLNDVVTGICSVEQVLVKDKRMKELYLLPACKSLSFASLDIEHMKTLIKYLQKMYDFIIIDCPAGVEEGFDYSTSLADEAILVTNLDLASLRDGDRVIGLLSKKNINSISLVINKVNNDDIDKGRSLTINDAIESLAVPLLGIVYDDHEMIEANNKGMPIYMNKTSLLHKCFNNIGSRILGNKVPYVKYKKKNLLTRLFVG